MIAISYSSAQHTIVSASLSADATHSHQASGCCRYKYKLDGEAVGLGISGGVTALCLTLLTAAVTGGAAAQNTGGLVIFRPHVYDGVLDMKMLFACEICVCNFHIQPAVLYLCLRHLLIRHWCWWLFPRRLQTHCWKLVMQKI